MCNPPQKSAPHEQNDACMIPRLTLQMPPMRDPKAPPRMKHPVYKITHCFSIKPDRTLLFNQIKARVCYYLYLRITGRLFLCSEYWSWGNIFSKSSAAAKLMVCTIIIVVDFTVECWLFVFDALPCIVCLVVYKLVDSVDVNLLV